jgi:hypothetical protein
MSERIEQSMYDNFPFEIWSQISRRNRLDRKLDQLKHGFRFWRLKRNLARNQIADVKIDFSSVSRFTAEQFPQSGPYPWLDRSDAVEQIRSRQADGRITAEQAEQAEYFRVNGYLVLKQFPPPDLLDAVWNDYEKKVYEGRVPVETYQKDNGDLFLGRCLNPHMTVPGLRQLSHYRKLVDIISLLMGVDAIPFQTIMGFAGSEQAAHSDAIHMTTYPLGYLAAAWMAMEDIHPDSGPLVYYPGSHRLPYVFTHNLVDSDVSEEYKRTTWYNDVYEPEIQRLIRKNNLKARYFSCNRGDVLIWHSNLLHGGSGRNDPRLSRKAMVAHYFGKGAICFGDRNEAMVDPYQG